MELEPRYDGLTITPLHEYGRFDANWWEPLLLLEVRDRKGYEGFMAGNRVHLYEGTERTPVSGVAAPYSELAVGGLPADPKKLPGQLWSVRRPTPEKRSLRCPWTCVKGPFRTLNERKGPFQTPRA
jgi:hypothetical protein